MQFMMPISYHFMYYPFHKVILPLCTGSFSRLSWIMCTICCYWYYSTYLDGFPCPLDPEFFWHLRVKYSAIKATCLRFKIVVPSGFSNLFGLSDETHIVSLDLPVINLLDYTWIKTLFVYFSCDYCFLWNMIAYLFLLTFALRLLIIVVLWSSIF